MSDMERLHDALDEAKVPQVVRTWAGVYARLEWLVAENRAMAATLKVIHQASASKDPT